MRLNKISIERRPSYHKNAGQLEGEVEFESETGVITLRLTPSHVEQIINVCADSLVVVSKEVARELTAEIIEQSNLPQLENDA